MTRKSTTVAEAIGQTRPFKSIEQEGVLSLLLAADAVQRSLTALLAPQGVTHQQYNVLRILRGAGRAGLPTLEIGQRMVERTPGVTRLIDRLERKGWVARERDGEDRRQVRCRVTPAGRRLLARLDDPVDRWDDEVFAPLSKREMRAVIQCLDRVRCGRD